ncbi:Fe-S oxidoreductase-like protein [Candidatus Sulfobium mesophilum]|uniref:Fe-S oxidoreductase-like protein n=1 Tax=Candidatus Sulfobium mesophilum TaxID=2016548 RepID=A0A2U3QEV7_9BACT|nr:Fe-S oxidoreductase-like protein [Candidatus Sulfobium mesophilum]
MNLRELTWPLRMYWDLSGTFPDPGLCLKICSELVEIKILFLYLRVGSPAANGCCNDILGRLKGGNTRVSVTVSDLAILSSVLGQVDRTSLKLLLAEASSLHDVWSLIELAGREGKEESPFGISFEITQENFHEVPDVVSYCAENGIRDLVFPIQRLETGKSVFCVSRTDREEISRGLEGLDYSKLRLTIHDPFLWKIFFPDADYHEGGCQAANSMIYISPLYKVWPCPAMPVELGDLYETCLKDIILSEGKKRLRSVLLNSPGECAACDSSEKCLGGCRGRAYAMTGSLTVSDPACR